MVYTILAEGFEEIEALTVVDILRRADIPVKMASADGTMIVVGAHGIAVKADCALQDVEVSDLLFLPGGMPGVLNLEQNEDVINLITKYANSENGYIAAICAAPKILGGMGLLSEKHAVCYPGFEADLAGATVLQDAVVQEDRIITSRGAGTASDLAFHLVSLLKDDELADKLRTGMIYV
ncbi:MAG: DJ-1/PfpI family protein [Clostridia bacterium]|nr:DJ-1/PfpI family protein [Clostridia bacterium]